MVGQIRNSDPRINSLGKRNRCDAGPLAHGAMPFFDRANHVELGHFTAKRNTTVEQIDVAIGVFCCLAHGKWEKPASDVVQMTTKTSVNNRSQSKRIRLSGRRK